MKKLHAALALGTVLVFPSCAPKPAVINRPPAIELRQDGAKKQVAENRNGITVRWKEGRCVVSHDGVFYFRGAPGREQRGAVEFFAPAIIPPDETIMDALPGPGTTAILTNKSIFFTVGWENAFSDKTPTPEKPVMQDFFLKSYDVEDLMKKRILGWAANDNLEGFLLERGGILHMLGVEGGKIRLAFNFNIPFAKNAAIGYHDGDLFIAHPGVYFIAGVRNAGKEGRTFTMMLRKPLVEKPVFRVVSGVMVLMNGSEALPLIKNEGGEYGKVLEPIR